MIESIPVNIVEGWITELQAILKGSAQESKTQPDFLINKGMRHGIAQIEGKLSTWLHHQENMETLARSGKQFLITKDVNLSDGRYRKLEWYEGNLFLVLAWLHAKDAPTGELLLEIEQVQDLSTEYLVYRGALSYDELVDLARDGGMEAVRHEGNRQDWVEKVWT